LLPDALTAINLSSFHKIWRLKKFLPVNWTKLRGVRKMKEKLIFNNFILSAKGGNK
jgi:hypothetical protein